MKLPIEIRNMIYEYCLVVSGQIVPYAENYERDTAQDYTGEKPTIGLLAVDKTIRTEAASIFYGKNVWRVTARVTDLADGSTTTNLLAKSIWKVHAALFRRVTVYFHRLDVNELDSRALLRFRRVRRAKRMARAHQRNTYRMVEHWREKLYLVYEMENLTSIDFNVGQLFCLNGCCRRKILERLFVLFTNHWEEEEYLWSRALVAVNFVGLKNKKEADLWDGYPWDQTPEPRFIIDEEDKVEPASADESDELGEY